LKDENFCEIYLYKYFIFRQKIIFFRPKSTNFFDEKKNDCFGEQKNGCFREKFLTEKIFFGRKFTGSINLDMREAISVYCRIKPSQKEGKYEVSNDGEISKLEVVVPRLDNDGHVNNKTELHRFKFKHVFSPNAYQDKSLKYRRKLFRI